MDRNEFEVLMELFRRDPEFKETYLWFDEFFEAQEIKLSSHEIIKMIIDMIELKYNLKEEE